MNVSRRAMIGLDMILADGWMPATFTYLSVRYVQAVACGALRIAASFVLTRVFVDRNVLCGFC